MKQTPLTLWHKENGGRLVEFAGWEMPVTFGGLTEEHRFVRSSCGLFDVSHMGEFFVRGEKALKDLQNLTTNDVSALNSGQAQYTLLTNQDGGVVDDLIVYCLEKDKSYLLCVNAANEEKDWKWIQRNSFTPQSWSNESEKWGQIAVQGPKAWDVLEPIFSLTPEAIRSFEIREVDVLGQSGYLARTGYTGEDGAEIFTPWQKTQELWKKLLSVGGLDVVKPIGLGARDTLRIEAKLPLYGNELNDSTTPHEAKLAWVVKADKKDFIGKEAMLAKKAEGLERKLVGFKVIEKGIPRKDYPLFSFDNEEIGRVTSGTQSPSLGYGIGIAYVAPPHSVVGSQFHIQIRNRRVKAEVVKTPFYTKQK